MDHLSGQVAQTPQQAQQLEGEGFLKCRNPQCNYFIAPQELESMENEGYFFSCPKCKLTYPLMDPTPFHVQGGGVVGNQYENYPEDYAGIANRQWETVVGLTMKQQGDIGEELVKGLKEIPGYGPITWWSDTYNDPIDGGAGEWAIEVKTLCIDARNHRFIPGNQPRRQQMIARAQELGFSGILGMLVILDYRRSVADIYTKEMPNGEWRTAPSGPYPEGMAVRGPVAFRKGTAQHLIAEIPFSNPFLNPASDEPQVFEHTGDDIPF